MGFIFRENCYFTCEMHKGDQSVFHTILECTGTLQNAHWEEQLGVGCSYLLNQTCAVYPLLHNSFFQLAGRVYGYKDKPGIRVWASALRSLPHKSLTFQKVKSSTQEIKSSRMKTVFTNDGYLSFTIYVSPCIFIW